MGGVASQGGHTLEFRFSYPRVGKFPPNKSRTLSLFAEVGLLSQSDDEVGTIVQWEEPVTVRLPNDREVVLVTVWAAESRDDVASGDAQHVSEVVVPYGGACGLSSLGVQQGPLVMRLALRKDARSRCEAEDLATDFVNAREQGKDMDKDCIMFRVSQVGVSRSPSNVVKHEVITPRSEERVRHQILSLEFQNRALERQLPDAEVDSSAQTEPSELRALQALLEENERLTDEKDKAFQRVMHVKDMQTKLAKRRQVSNPATSWSLPSPTSQSPLHCIRAMQDEIRVGKERREKIEEAYSRKLDSIKATLKEERTRLNVMEQSSTHVALSDALQVAQTRRENLLRQLESPANAQQAGPDRDDEDLSRLRESLLRCREEIQRHEHELKMQSSLQPSAQQKTLNDEIDALSEQLDFIDRSQRDQQLIFDAEVKELKKTLALTEEELEIATSAVTRVKENIKAVRKVKELEMHGTASINDIEELRASNDGKTTALENLGQAVLPMNEEIQQLEEEQRTLMLEFRQACSSRSLPGTQRSLSPPQNEQLEARAQMLHNELVRASEACDTRLAEIAHMESETGALQAHADELRDIVIGEAESRSRQENGNLEARGIASSNSYPTGLEVVGGPMQLNAGGIPREDASSSDPFGLPGHVEFRATHASSARKRCGSDSSGHAGVRLPSNQSLPYDSPSVRGLSDFQEQRSRSPSAKGELETAVAMEARASRSSFAPTDEFESGRGSVSCLDATPLHGDSLASGREYEDEPSHCSFVQAENESGTGSVLYADLTPLHGNSLVSATEASEPSREASLILLGHNPNLQRSDQADSVIMLGADVDSGSHLARRSGGVPVLPRLPASRKPDGGFTVG